MLVNMAYKKRKPISKKLRDQILLKTEGRCGYCGVKLTGKWHIDHIIPFSRSKSNDSPENLMASCPQCNRFKCTFTLEEFRSELKDQVTRARKYSVNFRFAEKYGLIKVIEKPIVFYFENKEEE